MAANGISELTIASGATLTKNINPPHSNSEIVAPYSAIWSLNYSGALGATDSVSYKLYVTSLGVGSAFTLTSHYGDYAVTAGNFLYDTYGTSLGIIKGNATIDNYMAKAAAVSGSLSNSIITAATYKGTWNAFTDTPTLTDGVGTLGDAYDVATAGTSGAYPEYAQQDWRIYDGAVWQRVDKTTTTEWTIKPATSGLADKEARQTAKLDIAKAKRQGKTVAVDGTITGSVDSTKSYYRSRNTLDIDLLPTKYSGNLVVDNRKGTVTGISPNPDVSSIPNGSFTSIPPAPILNYAIPGSDVVVNVTWGPNGPSYYSPRFEIVNGGANHVAGGSMATSDQFTVPFVDMGITGGGNWTLWVAFTGLQQGRPWVIAPFIGSDNPANAAEPDATAWVLMDGPFGNESGFYGGQSWRKMSPIGYFPYGRETYTYGDETVRFDGTWRYENTTLGLIATGGVDGAYPWQATWTGSYTAAKITAAYVKTTNYPAVP